MEQSIVGQVFLDLCVNVNTLSTLFSHSCQRFYKRLMKGKEKAENLAFVSRIVNFLSMSGESFRILFCVCFRF